MVKFKFRTYGQYGLHEILWSGAEWTKSCSKSTSDNECEIADMEHQEKKKRHHRKREEMTEKPFSGPRRPKIDTAGSWLRDSVSAGAALDCAARASTHPTTTLNCHFILISRGEFQPRKKKIKRICCASHGWLIKVTRGCLVVFILRLVETEPCTIRVA